MEKAAPAPRKPGYLWSRKGRDRLKILGGQIAVVVSIFGLWELAVRIGWLKVYLYGLPSGVFTRFVKLLMDGTLPRDFLVTGIEAVLGFLIGSTLGTMVGLLLWLSPTAGSIVRPLVLAINGLPKIALAPLIIVWFGIGIESKIAIAAIITFIVSMVSASAGAMQVDQDLVRLMRSLGASRFQTFKKVVVPSTVPWIVSAMRLNVGFALIGAVAGEYIAAKTGLGYMVYFAGTLYDLNTVWVGLFSLILLALCLNYTITFLERKITRY